jgi:hypothetical protein
MRKLTWDVATVNKTRCEVCKGAFGLTRQRFAHKQFCSAQCLERYQAERARRTATFTTPQTSKHRSNHRPPTAFRGATNR